MTVVLFLYREAKLALARTCLCVLLPVLRMGVLSRYTINNC